MVEKKEKRLGMTESGTELAALGSAKRIWERWESYQARSLGSERTS